MSFIKVARNTEILEVRDAEYEVNLNHMISNFLTKGVGKKVSEINQNINTACVHCSAVKICHLSVLCLGVGKELPVSIGVTCRLMTT